jgi:hypothetical protein
MPLAAIHLTGLPALLIIIVILVLLIAGAITMLRLTARGAKRIAGAGDPAGDGRVKRD